MDRQTRHTQGFTLVEMLIVIAIFGFVMAATSQMFVSMLRTHRQQSRITETNIEGLIGLEILRQDLGKAGYGLPWSGTFNYTEKATDTCTLNDAPSNAPRGIVGKNDVTGVAGILTHTDYLAIKAANVALNSACSKWTFLLQSGATVSWSPSSENMSGNDRIIVITPDSSLSSSPRTLVTGNAKFSAVGTFVAPTTSPETRTVYGIDSNTDLRMPFNRADYFVMQPLSSDMPKRCAAGTGILYKGVVNQSDGGVSYMPLLDCVADMQVVYLRDLDNDGFPENWTEDISASDAATLRTQVKEVRVFILAHEGQRDPDYRHPVSSIHVGDAGFGRDFDLTTITDWQFYRWKIYTLVVKLENLG